MATVDVMYGLSPPKLTRVYRAYGFDRVEEAGEILAFSTRVRGVVSTMTRDRLLQLPIAGRLRRFSEELKDTGSIAWDELGMGTS